MHHELIYSVQCGYMSVKHSDELLFPYLPLSGVDEVACQDAYSHVSCRVVEVLRDRKQGLVSYSRPVV